LLRSRCNSACDRSAAIGGPVVLTQTVIRATVVGVP
jgi:hypothetical protein